MRDESLRTLQEQRVATVVPLGDFVASRRLPRHVRTGRWSRKTCAAQLIPHTCNDEDAQELVAAYAPLMLASAVHFFRAASLIDSSTRLAAAAAAAQAAAFLQILVKWVPWA